MLEKKLFANISHSHYPVVMKMSVIFKKLSDTNSKRDKNMSDTFSKCIAEKDVRHDFEARKKRVRHVFKANEEKRCQTRFLLWVKKVSDTFCIPQDKKSV